MHLYWYCPSNFSLNFRLSDIHFLVVAYSPKLKAQHKFHFSEQGVYFGMLSHGDNLPNLAIASKLHYILGNFLCIAFYAPASTTSTMKYPYI